MKLTLLSQHEYSAMVLPEKHAGHYWVRGRNTNGKMTDVVAVEALRSVESGGVSQWIMKSNRRFKILDKNNNELPNVPLNPLELYRVQSTDGNLKFVLYTEPLSDDRKLYKGYETDGNEKNWFIRTSNKQASETCQKARRPASPLCLWGRGLRIRAGQPVIRRGHRKHKFIS